MYRNSLLNKKKVGGNNRLLAGAETGAETGAGFSDGLLVQGLELLDHSGLDLGHIRLAGSVGLGLQNAP